MPIQTYSTVRRHFRNAGLSRQPRDLRRDTEGTRREAERKEVRSFEIEHGHGHWHLDDHHGSRKMLSSDGQWQKPVLLAILDDRSRLICHLQRDAARGTVNWSSPRPWPRRAC